GEQGAVQFGADADPLRKPEPDVVERRLPFGLQLVARMHLAEFERTGAVQPAPLLAWQRGQDVGRRRFRWPDVLWGGYLRHRRLVPGAVLLFLDRGRAE